MQNKVKRYVSAVMALALTMSTFTACGGNNVKTMSAEEAGVNVDVSIEDIKAMPALSFEELASANNEVDTDELVYKYVSDSVLVDSEGLVAITEEDDPEQVEQLNGVIESINEALHTGESNPIIDDGLLNYMLLKFANTPYTWRHSKTEIVGMDAQTGLYFVDVTYETNDGTKSEITQEDKEVEYKELIDDSVIVLGADNEETLRQKMYTDYMVWLESEMQDGAMTSNSAWQKLLQNEYAMAQAQSVLLGIVSADEEEVVMDGYEVDKKDTEEATTEEETTKGKWVRTVDENGSEVTILNCTFEDRWGDLDELMRVQNGTTLLERVKLRNSGDLVVTQDASDISDAESVLQEGTEEYREIKGLGAYTYSGLTEVAADHGATITFRFILNESFDIALDGNINVRSMYLKNYALNGVDELVTKYTTDTVINGDVLTPYIETLISSYRKAIDETNHIGLNNLFEAYRKYDKYFNDVCNYSYITGGGYSLELIGRKGDEIAVKVIQKTKDRAKGTNMTMPTYTEEVLIKVKLCGDDKIRLVSLTPLSLELIGEPLSVVRNVSGISEQISYNEGDFTAANQAAIEKVIQDFSILQLEYEGALPESAWDTIDLGISSTEKAEIKELFDAVAEIDGTKSYIWLTGFETKTNLYVKCKLREIFTSADGSKGYATESELGIIYRNGAWKVISYDRLLATKVGKLDTTNALLINDINSEPKSQLFTRVDQELLGTQIGGLDTENADENSTEEGWDDVSYGQETEATSTDGTASESTTEGAVSESTTEATEAVTEATESVTEATESVTEAVSEETEAEATDGGATSEDEDIFAGLF